MKSPQRLTKQTKDLIDRVVSQADDLIEQGHSPDFALAKSAFENKLDVGYIPLAVRAINTAQAILQLKRGKDAWEKAASYPVATVEGVRKQLENFARGFVRQIDRQPTPSSPKIPEYVWLDRTEVVPLSKSSSLEKKSVLDTAHSSSPQATQYKIVNPKAASDADYNFSPLDEFLCKFFKIVLEGAENSGEKVDNQENKSASKNSSTKQAQVEQKDHYSENVRAFNLDYDISVALKNFADYFNVLPANKKASVVRFIHKRNDHACELILKNLENENIKTAQFDPFYNPGNDETLLSHLNKLNTLIEERLKLDTKNYLKWAYDVKPHGELSYFFHKKASDKSDDVSDASLPFKEKVMLLYPTEGDKRIDNKLDLTKFFKSGSKSQGRGRSRRGSPTGGSFSEQIVQQELVNFLRSVDPQRFGQQEHQFLDQLGALKGIERVLGTEPVLRELAQKPELFRDESFLRTQAARALAESDPPFFQMMVSRAGGKIPEDLRELMIRQTRVKTDPEQEKLRGYSGAASITIRDAANQVRTGGGNISDETIKQLNNIANLVDDEKKFFSNINIFLELDKNPELLRSQQFRESEFFRKMLLNNPGFVAELAKRHGIDNLLQDVSKTVEVRRLAEASKALPNYSDEVRNFILSVIDDLSKGDKSPEVYTKLNLLGRFKNFAGAIRDPEVIKALHEKSEIFKNEDFLNSEFFKNMASSNPGVLANIAKRHGIDLSERIQQVTTEPEPEPPISKEKKDFVLRVLQQISQGNVSPEVQQKLDLLGEIKGITKVIEDPEISKFLREKEEVFKNQTFLNSEFFKNLAVSYPTQIAEIAQRHGIDLSGTIKNIIAERSTVYGEKSKDLVLKILDEVSKGQISPTTKKQLDFLGKLKGIENIVKDRDVLKLLRENEEIFKNQTFLNSDLFKAIAYAHPQEMIGIAASHNIDITERVENIIAEKEKDETYEVGKVTDDLVIKTLEKIKDRGIVFPSDVQVLNTWLKLKGPSALKDNEKILSFINENPEIMKSMFFQNTNFFKNLLAQNTSEIWAISETAGIPISKKLRKEYLPEPKLKELRRKIWEEGVYAPLYKAFGVPRTEKEKALEEKKKLEKEKIRQQVEQEMTAKIKPRYSVIPDTASYLSFLRRDIPKLKELGIPADDLFQLAKLEVLEKIINSEELKPYSPSEIIAAFQELFDVAPYAMTVPSYAKNVIATRLASGTLPTFEMTKLIELDTALSKRFAGEAKD